MLTLDTELLWSLNSKRHLRLFKKKQNKAMDVIPSILKMLEDKKVSATWAMVGHLFFERKEDVAYSSEINEYTHYERETESFSSHFNESLYHSPSSIEKILDSNVYQEIGYHSYSHPIFTQISKKEAEKEIKLSKKIEKKWDIKLKSFVFPKDQVNYLNLLKRYDFKIFRSPPIFEDNNPNRISQGLGNFFPKSVFPFRMNGLWSVNTSMIYFDPKIPFIPIRFPYTSLPSARFGLKRAIKRREIFHLFFHPWNMIIHDDFERNLRKFLEYVSKMRESTEMKIITMGQLADSLEKKSKKEIK